jgi:predicted alpha/beta hydrolase family esterase
MSGWRPWLKEKLEAEGYEVWVPALPENDTPNLHTYNDFLFGEGWDFTDNIVVGHSSGAVEILDLLMDDRCPKIKLAVPVSSWNGALKNETPELAEQMSGVFPDGGFDFEKIKQNAERIAFLHSDNDPYCPLEQAQDLANRLDAEITVLHTNYGNNADHLGSPLTELPELWTIIEPSL